MPMIASVLAEAELSVDALDLIAVTIGPGGFTGLRIGLAAARGLALATGVPLLGITSFAAVAASVDARPSAPGCSLVVALDSKRSELYLQGFAADGTALADGRAPWLRPPQPAGAAGFRTATLAAGGRRRARAWLAESLAERAAGAGAQRSSAGGRRRGGAAGRRGMASRPKPAGAAAALFARPGHHPAAPWKCRPMTRSLRPVAAADFANLARLHAQCFPDDRWDEKALAELLAMPGAKRGISPKKPGEPAARVHPRSRHRRRRGSADIGGGGGVAPPGHRAGPARGSLRPVARRAGAQRVVGLEVAADNSGGAGGSTRAARASSRPACRHAYCWRRERQRRRRRLAVSPSAAFLTGAATWRFGRLTSIGALSPVRGKLGRLSRG